MEYSFREMLHDLKCGREIEFIYNEKNYSIVNGNDKWFFCEEQKSIELCGFEEKSILVKKIKNMTVQNESVENVINKKLYRENSLYIL